MQGEHICNPDPEGLPVCGGEQGSGAECQGESQGHGVASQGYLLSDACHICTEGHVLLKDDERLKNERVRALKAKERFAQSTAGELDLSFHTESLFMYNMNLVFPLFSRDHAPLQVFTQEKRQNLYIICGTLLSNSHN